MSESWEERVKDIKERKVFGALSDPEWDFRTIPGIAKASGLSESEVERILEKYPDLVRKSPIPDREGRDLYTVSSRPVSTKEVIAEIRSFVTKSVSGN